MKPSQDLGKTGDLLKVIQQKDFSSLMPRPGWQKSTGLATRHL